MTSYSWSISGSGSIAGSSTDQMVTVNSGVCASSFDLTLTVTDEHGCSSICNITVSSFDITPPTFTVPANTTVTTDANCEFDVDVAITGDVTDETDNCSTGLNATFTDAIINGSCDGSKIITRTWKLMDDCMNTTTHIQTILVKDLTPPTFTVPANITIFTDASCSYDADPLITGLPANELDNCTPFLDGSTTMEDDEPVAGDCEGTFSILRTWTLGDGCGNQTSHVQTITITDNSAPSFTRPQDITITTDTLCNYDASVEVTGDVMNEADNCTTNLQAEFTDTNVPGTCDGSVIISRTWTLSDDCENWALPQIQTITVIDNIDPWFTVPADVTIFKDASCGYSAAVNVTGDVTDEQDNCDLTLAAIYNDTVDPGSCAGEEIITRIWILTDACNNSTSHTQVITVKDNTSPVISSPDPVELECSTSIPLPASTISGFLSLSGSAATDNCTPQHLLEVNSSDGSLIGSQCNGSIIRTYVITDDCGNTATATQVFNISDNTVPSITAGTIADCYETVAQAEAAALAATTSSDNCTGSVTLSVNTTEGTCDSTITVTATDACGNTNNVVYETRINCQVVRLKVFLEGAYNAAGDSMRTSLNTNHLLPGQNTTLLFVGDTPLGQPYNTPPYSYNGNSGNQYGDPPYAGTPYPADVVDWVLVTVREEGILPANNIWTCAGWVHSDGRVTFPDNCPPPTINIANDYYIVVQHRNHLGIMSPLFVDIECNGAYINWDFTLSDSYKPPFRTGQKLIDGIWAMLAGNGEQANTIKVISSPDLTIWSQQQGTTGYRKGDHNMNISVNSADETVWKINQNKTSGVIFY
jgi:hypothetical protein